MGMDFTYEIAEGVVWARLVGRLDIHGTAEIETDFRAVVLANPGAAAVDMAEVDFVSSMGLRMLLSCTQQLLEKGRVLVLINPHRQVVESLEVSGIDKLIPVAPDRARAREIISAAN